MLIIVCIKQVLTFHQIGDDAFNPETGQLMRGRLPVVVNELDIQALALAVDMKECARP